MHIPYDVAFTIGYFVSIFYGAIFSYPRAGLLIALILAITNEIDDTYQYNAFDWMTTVSMMCGAAVAYMMLNIWCTIL